MFSSDIKPVAIILILNCGNLEILQLYNFNKINNFHQMFIYQTHF